MNNKTPHLPSGSFVNYLKCVLFDHWPAFSWKSFLPLDSIKTLHHFKRYNFIPIQCNQILKKLVLCVRIFMPSVYLPFNFVKLDILCPCYETLIRCMLAHWCSDWFKCSSEWTAILISGDTGYKVSSEIMVFITFSIKSFHHNEGRLCT